MFRAIVALTAIPVFLTACSGPVDPAAGAINDPYEETNRRVHEFNKNSDKSVVRPLATAYAEGMPPGFHQSVGNFKTNFATPAMVVNDLLQFEAEDAMVNTFRFAVNTVVGLGGLIDVAGEFGVPARETGFGETLHFWQVPEGAYLELPFVGPSTARDAGGAIGDIALNPLNYVLPSPERYAGLTSRVLHRMGQRGEFAATVDSVLHESADSYAQARSAYLQNRRYELGGTSAYDDPYGTSDAYADPYLDPYAE